MRAAVKASRTVPPNPGGGMPCVASAPGRWRLSLFSLDACRRSLRLSLSRDNLRAVAVWEHRDEFTCNHMPTCDPRIWTLLRRRHCVYVVATGTTYGRTPGRCGPRPRVPSHEAVHHRSMATPATLHLLGSSLPSITEGHCLNHTNPRAHDSEL